LKNCVSDDSDWDTVTRWYQWENEEGDSIAAAEESRNSGPTAETRPRWGI